jgi:hypothetical protein
MASSARPDPTLFLGFVIDVISADGLPVRHLLRVGNGFKRSEGTIASIQVAPIAC